MPADATPLGRPHPRCWTGTTYEHACHEPSGRACIDCGQPAGTPWGPYWCPDCDVVRLDRVSRGFAAIVAELGDLPDTPPAPPVVEVAVEALEASHRRLLDAQGLIATEIGRVSLTLRRAHGAVVPPTG